MPQFVIFDTSAINALLDDNEQAVITTALLNIPSFEPRITAVNVLEAIATDGDERRTALLALMRRLTKRTTPLDRPNTILMNQLRGVVNSQRHMKLNRDEALEGVWEALFNPSLITDSEKQEVAAWAKEWKNNAEAVIAKFRGTYQEAFRRYARNEIPTTVSSTLRFFLERHKDIFFSIVSDIHKLETGRELAPSTYDTIFAGPYWRLYFAAHMYGLHRRSFATWRYGKKQSAGPLDLIQAVYLPLCNKFVTNDRNHFKAMRLLNCLSPKKKTTEVLTYASFRKRLLL